MSMQFAIPSMLSLVALTCPALAVASAQTPIPIRTTAPAAQSPEQFGSSLGIRALPNGKAMVHDPAHKRMIVFDSSMQSFTVSADTVGTSGTKYPSAYGGAQLTPY
ncbi:MAG: hypothetical protein ABJB66_07190, partial [Gemmatimonadaceae bacterium]